MYCSRHLNSPQPQPQPRSQQSPSELTVCYADTATRRNCCGVTYLSQALLNLRVSVFCFSRSLLPFSALLALRCNLVCRSARQGCGRHPQACPRLAPPPQAERAWYRCRTGCIMRFRYARTEVSLRPWSPGRIRGRADATLPSYSEAGWSPDGPRPQQEGQRNARSIDIHTNGVDAR